MGKQAKKKQKTDAQSKDQKKHNRQTRGCNTKNRPIVWETRQEVYKDADGNEKTRTIKITYPNNTQWDWSRIYDAVVDNDGVTKLMRRKASKQKPLPAPLDTLLDDNWEDDFKAYAEEEECDVERTILSEGQFRYEMWREEPSRWTGKPERRVILSVESSRSMHVKKRKKFSRKKN